MRLAAALLACFAGTACLDQAADLVPVPADRDGGFVPLPAGIDAGPGCHLGVTPPSLDFGNVPLGEVVTDQIGLWNDGGDICAIAGLSLIDGSDPGFSLPPWQPTSFFLEQGTATSVAVTFNASDDRLPHWRKGMLDFQCNDWSHPDTAVPLSAYINDTCTAAGELMYLVDETGELSSFDPSTLVFNDIGQLDCPFAPYSQPPPGWSTIGPFSMNVDQLGVAWVLFDDGELFRVDTATAACEATSFQVDQQGFEVFGMGSVFESSVGQDVLYIAGGSGYFEGAPPSARLGTLAFPSLTISTVGPLQMGWAELAGTGDGQLWGFVPAGRNSSTGLATLAQLDPASGDTLQSYPLDGITDGGGFAMKFYGGSFWIFVGEAVYEVPRSTGKVSATFATGRSVVGAGISTCAPVQ